MLHDTANNTLPMIGFRTMSYESYENRVPIKREEDRECHEEDEHYYGYTPVEVKRDTGEMQVFAPSSPTRLMDLSNSERPTQFQQPWPSNVMFDTEDREYQQSHYAPYDQMYITDQRQKQFPRTFYFDDSNSQDRTFGDRSEFYESNEMPKLGEAVYRSSTEERSDENEEQRETDDKETY